MYLFLLIYIDIGSVGICQMLQHGSLSDLPCTGHKNNLEEIVELQKLSLQLSCNICHKAPLFHIFTKFYDKSYFILIPLFHQEMIRITALTFL